MLSNTIEINVEFDEYGRPIATLVGICHQAFEDLKTAYVLERGHRRKVADGEEFNSRGLED